MSVEEAMNHPWLDDIKQEQLDKVKKNIAFDLNVKRERPMTSKLQEATIMYIVEELNLKDLEVAKETFNLLDLDGDRRITKEEMLNNP